MQQEQHRATARVLEILEYLAAATENGYTLTEVASALNVPKSSLFPIIHTLEEQKYIRLDKRSGQYSIGIGTWLLSMRFSQEQGLQLISQIMQSVVETCQETCQLGILDQENVLYIEKADSPQTIRMISRVGKRLPANSTAIGKALLCGLDDDAVRALYPDGLPQLTEHTVVEMAKLLEQLESVRQAGVATEEEESTPQLRCWAVPLRRRNEVFAALSVSVPLFRCTPEKEEQVRGCLLDAQREIERLAEARNFSLL